MSHLHICLLGSIQATLDNLSIHVFRADKTRALLVYLVVEQQQIHRREGLAGMLWPELSEKAAYGNLRQALFRLRRAIPDNGIGVPYLLVTNKDIQFNPQSDFTIDVNAFEGLLNRYRTHHTDRSPPCSTCAADLTAAIDLYQGEFLAGFSLQDCHVFEHWRLVQKEYYHCQVLDALTHLLDYYESIKDYEKLCRYSLQKLGMDPWCERTYQQRMKALALSGRPGQALKQYLVCADVLSRDLEIMPSTETRLIYEQIRGRTLER
jgi:DNA-binding SARP family transcriptional activator